MKLGENDCLSPSFMRIRQQMWVFINGKFLNLSSFFPSDFTLPKIFPVCSVDDVTDIDPMLIWKSPANNEYKSEIKVTNLKVKFSIFCVNTTPLEQRRSYIRGRKKDSIV